MIRALLFLAFLFVSGTAQAQAIGRTAIYPGEADSGVTPIISSALETSHVLKASGTCLIFNIQITIQATSGVVMILNAGSDPGNGAVVPVWSQPVVSNGSFGGATFQFYPGPPLKTSSGCVVVFSSATTPFTETQSATAHFSVQVQ